MLQQTTKKTQSQLDPNERKLVKLMFVLAATGIILSLIIPFFFR